MLAFDTSTGVSAMAIVDQGLMRAELVAHAEARHGETLVPNLRRLLDGAGLGAAELDLVAVGTGPGSFTGLRIGIAAAKGLALAHRIPVVGVGSLRGLAAGALSAGFVEPGEPVAVVADAHKREVFAAVYRAPRIPTASPADASAAAPASPAGAPAADALPRPLRAPLDELLAPVSAAPEAAAALLAPLARDGALAVIGDGLRAHGDALADALRARGVVLCAGPPALAAPHPTAFAAEALALLAGRGPDALAALDATYAREPDITLK